jgi:glycerophosphoryl diester phosphodiesterase
VPAEATLAELRALDAGKWKDPKFAGTKIPTLEEVLAIVPPGKRFYIEIKTGPEIVPALKQSLARCSLAPEQTIIISFKDDAIAACRREMPHLKAHLIVSFKQDKKTNTWSPTLKQILARLDKTHASGLDVQGNLTFVNQPFVAALRQRGYEFHTWTIDKPEDARALQKLGVDSITTNKPAFLRSVLFPG